MAKVVSVVNIGLHSTFYVCVFVFENGCVLCDYVGVFVKVCVIKFKLIEN